MVRPRRDHSYVDRANNSNDALEYLLYQNLHRNIHNTYSHFLNLSSVRFPNVRAMPVLLYESGRDNDTEVMHNDLPSGDAKLRR